MFEIDVKAEHMLGIALAALVVVALMKHRDKAAQKAQMQDNTAGKIPGAYYL